MKYAGIIEANFDVIGKAGEEYTCRCPWHDDQGKPNLYVNAVKGVYLCHACGAKGHLDSLGATLPPSTTQDVRDRLRALTAPRHVQRIYPEGWLRQYDAPHPYWTDVRGLSPATVQRFRLGYDPFSNRMTLPLRDYRGRVLGVTFRRLDDGRPKYLHPKGFPIGKHLYAAWLLEDQRTVGLVEGQVDAIHCWSERVPALAMMGSRLTKDQVKVLQRLGITKVVLMMDNDKAGRDGTIRVYQSLQGSGIRVVSGWYRPYWRAKDPDGLKGDRVRKMYHSAVPILEWIDRSGYEVA
jgi:DNA primase (bacterial type)